MTENYFNQQLAKLAKEVEEKQIASARRAQLAIAVVNGWRQQLGQVAQRMSPIFRPTGVTIGTSNIEPGLEEPTPGFDIYAEGHFFEQVRLPPLVVRLQPASSQVHFVCGLIRVAELDAAENPSDERLSEILSDYVILCLRSVRLQKA